MLIVVLIAAVIISLVVCFAFFIGRSSKEECDRESAQLESESLPKRIVLRRIKGFKIDPRLIQQEEKRVDPGYARRRREEEEEEEKKRKRREEEEEGNRHVHQNPMNDLNPLDGLNPLDELDPFH